MKTYTTQEALKRLNMKMDRFVYVSTKIDIRPKIKAPNWNHGHRWTDAELEKIDRANNLMYDFGKWDFVKIIIQYDELENYF